MKPVVRALAEELSAAADPDAFLARNRDRITPQLAAAANDLAGLDLETGHLKEAKPVAGLAAEAYRRLRDPAGETRMTLVVLLARIPETQKPQEFANLRSRCLKLGDVARKLGKPDMAFSAEASATIASISQYQATDNQEEALPVLLQAMSDAAVALPHVKQSASRVWVQVLIKRLVWLLNDSSEFPFGVLGAREKRNALLKQIAAAVEREVPVDFHFVPAYGDEEETAQAAMVLANLSYAYGSTETAGKRLEYATQLAKDISDPDLWASVVTTRSEAEWAAGAPAARVRQLRDQAWRVATEVRSTYASRAGRIWAAYRADQIYGDVLLHQLSQPGAESQAMFAASEALKSRTLLDELAVPHTVIRVSSRAAELEQGAIGFKPLPKVMFEENPTQGAEMALVSALSAFDMPGARNHARSQAMDQLETMYREAGAGFQGVARTATLDQVQHALGPREALLEYVIPFSPADPVPGLWILFIRRDGPPVLAKSPLDRVKIENCSNAHRALIDGTPLDWSPLACLITNLRIGIQRSDRNFANKALQVLHFLLIDPILEQGGRLENVDRLIVVPEGPLHYIPFAALRDENGKYLVDAVAITMAPSASVWLRLSQRSSGVKQFAGYANPDLEYAGKELAEIEPSVKEARWTSAAVPAGQDKALLLKTMQSAGILHIASHGGFPEENAQDSHYLLIGSGRGAGSTLTAGEVRALDLSANRLTVLSVCNGGLYRLGPGNEVYGLMPAFLEAGAQSVMGTLWALDDRFGEAFMAEFYRHLAAGGPAGALRETQRHFMNNYNIKDWAAFVVMGAGSFSPGR
jgi:CHAT domain-containing protein